MAPGISFVAPARVAMNRSAAGRSPWSPVGMTATFGRPPERSSRPARIRPRPPPALSGQEDCALTRRDVRAENWAVSAFTARSSPPGWLIGMVTSPSSLPGNCEFRDHAPAGRSAAATGAVLACGRRSASRRDRVPALTSSTVVRAMPTCSQRSSWRARRGAHGAIRCAISGTPCVGATRRCGRSETVAPQSRGSCGR